MEFPKINPREIVVNKAKKDWANFYVDWITKHDLTYGEVIAILSRQISSEANGLTIQERKQEKKHD